MTGDDRLREELEELERLAPPELPPRPSTTTPARWLRFLAPAAVVVTAMLVTAVVAPGLIDGLRPMGSPSASGSAGIAAPSGLASTAPAAPQLAWHVVPFDEPGAILVAITEVEGSLILTGSLDGRPQAWTSEDSGTNWARAEVAIAAGANIGMMREVAGTSERLVAVGSYVVGDNDAETVGAVWTSADGGTTWLAAPESAIPSGTDGVAWNGSDFLIFDDANPPNAIDNVSSGLTVWASTGGAEWNAVTEPGLFGASGVDLLSVASVRGRTEILVRSGFGVIPWYSDDGSHWSETSTQVDALGTNGERFVGIVFDPTGSPRRTLVTSRDGVDWKGGIFRLEYPAGLTSAELTSLLSTPWGTLIHGSAPVLGLGVGGLAWFLPTDATVAELVDAGPTFSAAFTSDRVIGVGVCGPTQDCAPMLVIGEP